MSNWRKARRSKAYGDCVEAASYRKSSFSAELDCVEAASWRKAAASYSNAQCVEAACGPGVVGVRDSKLGGGGPVLEFPAAAWRAFTRQVRT